MLLCFLAAVLNAAVSLVSTLVLNEFPALITVFSRPQVSLLLERQLACAVKHADSWIILHLIMPPFVYHDCVLT